MSKKEKLKPGPEPKKQEDRAVVVSVSLRPEQEKALLKKGLIQKIRGRTYGLSQLIQNCLDRLL